MDSRRAGDTSLGEGGRSFPETEQDVVAQGAAGSLEELARRYWKPVYHVARVSWGKTNEDAKDLTQAFFAWLLESGALRRYARERGGFRAFLKSLLRHFLQHEDAALRALKRGGGTRRVDLDREPGPLADPGSAEPEQVFERAWRREVIASAVDRVRRRLEAVGQSRKFRAFQAYDFPSPQDRPTYRSLAAELGAKESDVLNWLSDVRAEIRAEVRAEIGRLAAGPEEAEDEWNAFFAP